MKNRILSLATAILALAIVTSCSVMCTKIKNHKWAAEYYEFVADAGNETVTETLVFTGAKKFTMTTKRFMPPYPAMYMNADGSVDTMPGYTSEYTRTGKYTFEHGLLILTFDDGGSMALQYQPERLEGKLPYGEDIVFKPVKD